MKQLFEIYIYILLRKKKQNTFLTQFLNPLSLSIPPISSKTVHPIIYSRLQDNTLTQFLDEIENDRAKLKMIRLLKGREQQCPGTGILRSS